MEKKVENTQLIPIVECYKNNPTIRALVALVSKIPGLDATDAFLCAKIEQIKSERFKCFYDELAEGEIQLTEDLIKSEDFLHAHFATLKAALNTRRREKIQMFAKMLKSYTFEFDKINIDEYEEYLDVLDELTMKEVKLMTILSKYEKKEMKSNEFIQSIETRRFWKDFINEATLKLKSDNEQIELLLTRLSRTGCFRIYGTSYVDQLEFSGRLTSYFYKLEEFVANTKI